MGKDSGGYSPDHEIRYRDNPLLQGRIEELEKENQVMQKEISIWKGHYAATKGVVEELIEEIREKDAEIEKLKTELTFTKEYLNPADTSFRKMIDAFRVLPKEKQDKLVELSRALVAFQSGGGEKSCRK